MRILLAVSGGIAAYKAPDIVRRLRERGAEVRCALTRAGSAFVSPLALEVVSGHRVWSDDYLQALGRGEEEHIEAAAGADLLLAAPATAYLVARLALGLADDFVTTTALAFPGPLAVAPAMHPHMWHHEATRGHVETLRRRGATFLGPVDGPLASGESGIGRMLDPEQIADAILGLHGLEASRGLAGRRVLVTAGPTWERLDPVRYLGNRSSGRMGFALAAEAARRGAEVVLVSGPVALETPPRVERVDVESAEDLHREVLARVEGCDLFLMAAAVADYRPDHTADHKLKKEKGPPTFALVENPDVLRAVVATAGGRALVVGFAAETDDLDGHARAKLARKGCDFLVANDVSRTDIAFGSDWNEVVVYGREAEPVRLPRQTKEHLAGALLDLFTPHLGAAAR